MHPFLGSEGCALEKQRNKVRNHEIQESKESKEENTQDDSEECWQNEMCAACLRVTRPDWVRSEDSTRDFYKNIRCKVCLMQKKVLRGNLLRSTESGCPWGDRVAGILSESQGERGH